LYLVYVFFCTVFFVNVSQVSGYDDRLQNDIDCDGCAPTVSSTMTSTAMLAGSATYIHQITTWTSVTDVSMGSSIAFAV